MTLEKSNGKKVKIVLISVFIACIVGAVVLFNIINTNVTNLTNQYIDTLTQIETRFSENMTEEELTKSITEIQNTVTEIEKNQSNLKAFWDNSNDNYNGLIEKAASISTVYEGRIVEIVECREAAIEEIKQYEDTLDVYISKEANTSAELTSKKEELAVVLSEIKDKEEYFLQAIGNIESYSILVTNFEEAIATTEKLAEEKKVEEAAAKKAAEQAKKQQTAQSQHIVAQGSSGALGSGPENKNTNSYYPETSIFYGMTKEELLTKYPEPAYGSTSFSNMNDVSINYSPYQWGYVVITYIYEDGDWVQEYRIGMTVEEKDRDIALSYAETLYPWPEGDDMSKNGKEVTVWVYLGNGLK